MIEVEHETRQLLVGAVLMAGTAIIQAFGVVTLEEFVGRVRERVSQRATAPRTAALLCSVILFFFGLHLVEMAVWAGFNFCVTKNWTFSVALYESAIAFVTLDTADLPLGWKFLSAAEGFTGLLMFAWTTGVLFNQTTWITEVRHKYLREHPLFGTGKGVR